MTRLESQIRELSPSVKDALFRRLMFVEDLAWLRDEKKKNIVIGFEVDLDEQELSGFALIAIQRHTVIAFVSDRDESPRLILFPALETLFDPGFDLLNLIVTRKEFRDATFNGAITGHGRFGDMVKDLTPPNRKMDLSDTIVDQIANIIEKEEEIMPESQLKQAASSTITSTPVKPTQLTKSTSSVETEPIVETNEEDYGYDPGYEEGPPEGFDDEPNNFDDYEETGYDDYDDYQDYSEEPEIEPSRSEKLKAQKFNSLSEVIDFTVMKLGVNRPLAVTLANKAMQSKVSPEFRVQLAVNIFCKLIDENKI